METWKEHMQRMQDTYGHLPNHLSSIAKESTMDGGDGQDIPFSGQSADDQVEEEVMETQLPFGQGQWVVWGIPTVERDDNTGLLPSRQRAEDEQAIYRTDSEEEARRLVQEGGFEHKGTFYATTRISNSVAARNKENIEQVSGVLKRDDPFFKG